MTIKEDLILAMQQCADASGDLSLRVAFGEPGHRIEINNETEETGQAWTVPGFMDCLMQAIAEGGGGGPGGAETFIELTDTPENYIGQALKTVRVNAIESALEFAEASIGVHSLGSNTAHTATTLAALNALISDATLDSASDPRTDSDAIHKSVSSEIHGLSQKFSLAGEDELVIEDSAGGWAKKKVAASLIGAGGILASDSLASSGTETSLALSKSPVVSADMPAGYSVIVFRNGKNMVYAGAPSDADEFVYVSATNSVNFLASGTADEYVVIYVTSAMAAGSGVDADAIHDNVKNEINLIALKGSPHTDDVLIIEDSEDEVAPGYAKKKITIGSLPTGDADAIHDNVKNEINLVTLKDTPHVNDVILIEDSEDEVAPGYAKKKVTIGSLPGGSGTDEDAIHDNVKNEINSVALKETPHVDDVILIEDSEDEVAPGYAKKKITVGSLSTGGADDDAIHDNVEGEIHAVAFKAAPVSTDELLIEDSESAPSWQKKRIQLAGIPSFDAAAIHYTGSGEINSITPKLVPDSTDILVVEEDAGGTWIKKKITVGSIGGGGGGTDPNAVHVNAGAEISGVALKSTPHANDVLLIEDSEDEVYPGYSKKRITVGSLSSGGYTPPVNTKGDLFGHNGSSPARIPVGPDGTALFADSTETLGIKWAAVAGGVSTLDGRFVTVDQPGGPGGDGDYATISAAVTALNAADGGTILLRSGVYTMTSPLFIEKQINIIGVEGSVDLRNNLGSGGGIVIQLDYAAAGSLIQNITISEDSGGVDSSGYAFYSNVDDVNVYQCAFAGSTQVEGGVNAVFVSCRLTNSQTGIADHTVKVSTATSQAKFINCWIEGADALYTVCISTGTSDTSSVSLENCHIVGDNATGVHVFSCRRFYMDKCQVIAEKPTNPGTGKHVLCLANSGLSIVSNTLLKIQNSGVFSDAAILLYNVAQGDQIILNNVSIDLDNTVTSHSLWYNAPITVQGVNITLKNVNVYNIKLPNVITCPLPSAGIITLDPLSSGEINLLNCHFNSISSELSSSINCSILTNNPLATGSGKISIVGCTVNAQDYSYRGSSDESTAMSFRGEAIYVGVVGCHFYSGFWNEAIASSAATNARVRILDCVFDFTDSPAQNYLIANLQGGKLCIFSNNIINREDISGPQSVSLSNWKSVVCTGNIENNYGSTGISGSIVLSVIDYATVHSNIVEEPILTTSITKLRPAYLDEHNIWPGIIE